jgi:hypothetical protein
MVTGRDGNSGAEDDLYDELGVLVLALGALGKAGGSGWTMVEDEDILDVRSSDGVATIGDATASAMSSVRDMIGFT